MPGFASLNVAVSGMYAAQAGLYVTGHNMSNVATIGYTRQQTLQRDYMYQNIGFNGNGALQVGLGTDISAIRQVRDKFLDQVYREEVKRVAFYAPKIQAGNEIQTILGELESDYQTQKIIKDMWDAINELNLYTSGLETRGNFISTAVSFIRRFSNISERLTEYQYNINEQVADRVYEVNSLIETINKYNNLIAESQASGDRPNDYLDSRNVAIDRLSAILDIDVFTAPSGRVDILCEGTELLANGSITKLGLKYSAKDYSLVEPVITSKTAILPYDSDVKPLFNMTGKINALNGNDKGELKSLLAIRGSAPANYTSITSMPKIVTTAPTVPTAPPAPATQAQVDAYNTAMIQYQTDKKEYDEYQAFLAKYGPEGFNTGSNSPQFKRDIFNSTQALIPRIQREIDQLVHNIVTMINEAVAPSKPPFVLDTALGTVIPNTPNLANGNPNPYYTGPYALDKTTQGIEVFVRKKVNRFENGVYNGEDPSDPKTLYTFSNIIINPEFSTADGYSKLCLSANGDADNIKVLENLLTQWSNNFAGKKGDTVDKAYARIITGIASEIKEAQTIYDSQVVIVEAVEKSRQAMSGVSLDEEMTNMLKFQHAYNSSARILNVIDGMIERIINGMGIVGR